MNTTHHLESGLERETPASALRCIPASVDVSANSGDAPSAPPPNRLWSEFESSHAASPQRRLELKIDPIESAKKKECLAILRRQLSTRQIGWDSWDKLSEL